jgi:hypothetical protein
MNFSRSFYFSNVFLSVYDDQIEIKVFLELDLILGLDDIDSYRSLRRSWILSIFICSWLLTTYSKKDTYISELHPMKEFTINEFLSLKLEGGKTNLYVNDRLFEQCKFLLIHIPIEVTEDYDEIKSIDEAAGILGWTDEGQEGVEYNIDPETEFWGHCSNLQAWYENDYDTQLLHSNLAFPLLKHLTDCGDPSAKKVFKEEIAKRIESGYLPVVLYLIEEKYLRYLSSEELNVVLAGPTFQKFLTMPDACKMVYMFNDLIDSIKATDLLKENFLELLSVVENMPDIHDQYDAFRDLLAAIEGTELLKKYFLKLLAAVRKMRDNDYKRDAFNDLLEVLK